MQKNILSAKSVRIAMLSAALVGTGLAVQAAVSAANASDVPTRTAATIRTGAVRPCGNADVTATIIQQPDVHNDGYQRALIVVTNSSKRTCHTVGWPTITLTNAAAEAVAVPTRQVSEPGAGVPIDLAAGTSAYAGMKWNPCSKGDDTCPVGNWLRFGLPDTTDAATTKLDGFGDPAKSTITMRTLQIGTIQPIRDGVVAW